MQKIDSHQHFWKFDPVRDSWITDDMSVIQRDFMPDDLLPVMQQNDFDGCVAVQSDQTEEHNQFLINLANENPFIKGVVGWIDLQAGNIEERLEHYSTLKIIKGFRHVLQGEVERNFMLRPAFKNGIGLLSKYNFTYDILVFPDQLKYVKEFVSLFPNQKFVIDHIAKPYIKKGDMDEWAKDITAIAAYKNVHCKVSGMVTEANWQHWKKQDFTPYLDVVTEAFSIDRLMFGSDWPVCKVAASYSNMLQIVQDYFSGFTRNEKDQFFGGNATRFYALQSQ